MHQLATQGAAIEPPSEMITETDQHAFAHGDPINALLRYIEALRLGDFQKLLKQWPNLTDPLHMNSQSSTGLLIKTRLIRIAPGPHQQKEIRLMLFPKEFLPGLSGSLVDIAQQKIPPLR